jgi:hypothetical protein
MVKSSGKNYLLSLYTTVTAQKMDANWEEGLDTAWLVDGDKQMTR